MEDGLRLGDRAAAASVGAVLTSLLMTPLDVAKVRLQVQGRGSAPKGRCFVYSNGLMDHICTFCDPRLGPRPSTSGLTCEWYNRPPPPTPFRGTLDAMVKIARIEGPRSLWSGLSPTLAIAMPATVAYFTLNDHLVARWRAKFGDRFWVPMAAGSAARSAVVVLTNPVEMMRTKLQSESLSYRQFGQAFQVSREQEGIRVFWKGLTFTLARDVVFTAIYWGLLDHLRAFQIRREASPTSASASLPAPSRDWLPLW
jgi:solute carrier family 25 protein 39/40